MHRVELKLAQWRQLYDKLTEAETRLRLAGAGPNAKPVRDEVEQLRRESDEGLQLIHLALASRPRGSLSTSHGGGTPGQYA